MNYISYIINLKLSKYSIWQGIEEECFKKNYNFITIKFSLNVHKKMLSKTMILGSNEILPNTRNKSGNHDVPFIFHYLF